MVLVMMFGLACLAADAQAIGQIDWQRYALWLIQPSAVCSRTSHALSACTSTALLLLTVAFHCFLRPLGVRAALCSMARLLHN